MNWTEYFLGIASQVKLKSKDKYTQIGVVLVGSDNEIVSTGYNSFPRGINDMIDERQERPEKYYWFEHAERNSIYNAARIGVSTKGSKMYMTCGMSCADCARAIINAGIEEIWVKEDVGNSKEKWVESAIRSIQMFNEAGIKINYHNLDV
jgi:dCMP deaminase